MKFVVQHETPFHLWKHNGTYGGRNTAYAYRTAQTKAQQQRLRFRIVDDNNNLLDIFNT